MKAAERAQREVLLLIAANVAKLPDLVMRRLR